MSEGQPQPTDPAAGFLTWVRRTSPRTLASSTLAGVLAVALLAAGIGGPSAPVPEPGTPHRFAATAPDATEPLGVPVLEANGPVVPPTDLVGNLLSREGRGDWIRDEGLVATLAMLAGERAPDDVMAAAGQQPVEVTGILEMAADQLVAGASPEAAAELQRLLGEVVFGSEELDSMIIPEQPEEGEEQPEEQDEETAPSAPPAGDDEEPRGAACGRYYRGWDLGEEVEQCLAAEEIAMSGTTFRLLWPGLESPQSSWTDAEVELIRNVIDEAVPTTFFGLGALPAEVDVLMVAEEHAIASAGAWQPGEGRCAVLLYGNRAGLPPEQLQQAVAHQLAHCFQNATFPDQRVDYPARRWREEGYAEYLSTLAYPTADGERGVVDEFYRDELTTATVTSRTAGNLLWFQFLADLGGDEEIVELIAAGPTGGGVTDQLRFLQTRQGIREIHHDFVKATTDEVIVDHAGVFYTGPPWYNGDLILERPMGVGGQVDPFGVARWVLTIPAGTQVTVTAQGGRVLDLSMRPLGEPGAWETVSGGFQVVGSCDTDDRYIVVASGVTDREIATIDASGVEPRPEGQCARDLPSGAVASCLVGEWSMEIAPLLGAAQAQDVEEEGRTIAVDGILTLELRSDGSYVRSVRNFETQTLRPLGLEPDRQLETVTLNSRVEGRWMADSTTIRFTDATVEFDHIASEVAIDGAVASSVSGTPEDSAPPPDHQGQYLCEDGQLHIEGDEFAGRQIVWQQATKISTVARG